MPAKIISKFTKEDNRGELSLSTRKAMAFTCIDRKNLYDIMLEDTERGARSHLSGKEQEEVLKQVKDAREVNDMMKCLEERAFSELSKARKSFSFYYILIKR